MKPAVWSILVFALAYGFALAVERVLTLTGVPPELVILGAIAAIMSVFASADRVRGVRTRLRNGWPRAVLAVALFVALTVSGAFRSEDPATWPLRTVILAFPIVIAALLIASNPDPE